MNSNSTPQDDTIDLKELFFSLLSQWKLIALCTLLSLVFALLYLKVTPNVYSTDAMIQVEDAKGAGAAALLGETQCLEDWVENQLQMRKLKS